MASRRSKLDGDARTTLPPERLQFIERCYLLNATHDRHRQLELIEPWALEDAKAGNFFWLFDLIRARLSPPIAQEIIDLIESRRRRSAHREGRRRRPAHRIKNPELGWRDMSIALLMKMHLAKGMSPRDAKDLVAREFKVSKSTVRDACESFRGFKVV
jgi:hypothetical protein